MITQLSIQGLAIIDSLDIEFAPGFNVITGETGAGKSILIRALGLLTGGKASSDSVRSGFEVATVSGEFVVPDGHPVLCLLETMGIPIEKGKTVPLLVRRQVHQKGRSQAWVNDTPIATHSLKEIGPALLDVFAQHENQKLLHASSHVEYVDSFLDQPALRDGVQALGKACFETVASLQQELTRLADARRQSDYLTYRSDELQGFGPSVEDYNAVKNYCNEAENARKGRDPIAKALEICEGENGSSPLSLTKELAKALSGVAGVEALKDRVVAALSELDDVSFELQKRLSSMEFDEQKLEECQQRLFGYQDLFRKHSVRQIEDLVTQAEALSSQLESLQRSGQDLDKKLDSLSISARALKQACEKLTVARLQAVGAIKADVERELSELHMPGSVFQAELTPASRPIADLSFEGLDLKLAQKWEKIRGILTGLTEHGAEKAQFYLSANPGEPPMPLSKVASGGELSRIMLALKKALAADAETCVLVFDEIDTGISGRVADVVGKKMRELSRQFQVLCISHLPQVAVYADCHFLVAKAGKGERTQSSIVPLSKEDSAREIARLLSGRDVTSSSLAHAKSLIASAQKKGSKLQGARPE